jgi:hypothetical protein
LVAVTEVPFWVNLAFQMFVIFWLPENVHPKVHPSIADESLFVISTLTVAPVPQSFWVYFTEKSFAAALIVG